MNKKQKNSLNKNSYLSPLVSHPIRTIFLGSNWEALATLKTLHDDSRFNIVAVITQPDKPVGRKREIVESDIKKYCKVNNIPVEHPENNKERYKAILSQYSPELVVCISFGELVPEFFLEEPKYKAINVHFSLLPKYRGATPIQKAILQGEKETGISIVQMVKALDAGPIICQQEEIIQPTDTNLSLRERLVNLTSDILPDILYKWCNNEIKAIEQNHNQATYCQQSDIAKDNAYIDFAKRSASEVDRMVRAFIPWPIAWTQFQGKQLKIFSCSTVSAQDYEIQNITDNFLILKDKNGKEIVGAKCTDNQIVIFNEVQFEGKTKVTGNEFANGVQSKHK